MQKRTAPASLACCAAANTSAIHQARGLQACIVMSALRAVAAIFRTADDAEQACRFDMAWIEVVAMNAPGAKHQIGKRQAIKCCGLGAFPVIADRLVVAAVVPFRFLSRNHLGLVPTPIIIDYHHNYL
ncbi:hypothetical protein [Bradyrhizobium sp. USDA 4011]